MFSVAVRIVLITAFAAFAVYKFYHANPTGWVAVAGIAYTVLSYYRFGTVWLALRQYRRRKFDRAERYLRQIHKPKWLTRRTRAYYYFIYGDIMRERGRYTDAARYFSDALRTGLPSKNDAAVANVCLADCYLNLNKPAEAQGYLMLAKDMPYTEELGNFMREIESKIAGKFNDNA